ncbi:peptidase C14, caspase domain-containing protein [Chytriomyces sp. MP71]|nr:peptidase C14, caspase domain-containing protein [Chytriomyces sp. MP71]
MGPIPPAYQSNGKKKALIVGINYTGTRNALGGCVNDAYNIREHLTQFCNYSRDPHFTRMMVDEPREGYVAQNIPTTRNLLDAFYWLVYDVQPGDTLFFSYSGHGGQTEDQDGERANGLDDTICPVDFDRSGQIDSTLLHRCLVSALRPGVKLNVILDCCHSGTLLELPFTYRPDESGKMNTVQLVKRGMQLAMRAQNLLQGGFINPNAKGEIKGVMNEAKTLFNAITGTPNASTDEMGYKQENFQQSQYDGMKEAYCISGCQDEQTSADSSFNGRAAGALTHALLTTMRQYPQGLSFETLLASLRGFMMNEQYTQIPQLSCGHKVDPRSLFVL